METIRVPLIPSVEQDLAHLQEITGLNRTDITNRAITLYRFFETETAEGWQVLIQNPETDETRRVVLG
jgi:hypothetical protein